MSDPSPKDHASLSTVETISRAFTRLGWLGFWIQVALATLPIVMLGFIVVRSNAVPLPGRRFDLREYMAFGSLLILIFTMYWSYRYTVLGKRMLTAEQRPSSSSVIKSLWIGNLVGCVGAYISVALLLATVGRLLFVFMNAPQGGMQVVQTATEQRAGWISTMDMLDLMTIVFSLTAELTVLAFSLWLLFRMLKWVAIYDRASGSQASADANSISTPTP